MHIEQYVMAYGVEHDRLRALLPDGFRSLRPVVRFNAEIRDGQSGYVECNTAAESGGLRGWLNIGTWTNVPFVRSGKTVTFQTDFLELAFTPVGLAGGCPAEKDNEGCFFLARTPCLRPAEVISSNKEFCDCRFAWRFAPGDAHGTSIGKTLPAVPAAQTHRYPSQRLAAQNVAAIPCEQVLGTYVVEFER